MENLFTKKVPLYYETEESQLVLGDSFKILTKMEPESVDMIFADPPYNLDKIQEIPTAIFENDLLANSGILIIEHPANVDFSKHPRFTEHRQYGSVNFSLFK